jgi:hypothetical protein
MRDLLDTSIDEFELASECGISGADASKDQISKSATTFLDLKRYLTSKSYCCRRFAQRRSRINFRPFCLLDKRVVKAE